MNPEKNKNPEILPTNNVDIPQQTVVKTTVGQPIAGSEQVQPEPRKFNVKKIIPWVLCIVLLSPIYLTIFGIIFTLIRANVSTTMRENNAKKLENELSSLVFVEGQSINAKAVLEGDWLTGNDNPALSTYAKGTLSEKDPSSKSVNKSLAVLESKVSNNLSKSGFTLEGGSDTPYYSLNTNFKYDSIIFKYIKGDRSVLVIYRFDKPYKCPEEYLCEYTPKSEKAVNVFPVNEFGNLNVTNMYIYYSDKSYEYIQDWNGRYFVEPD
jgi:hypothetical protein